MSFPFPTPPEVQREIERSLQLAVSYFKERGGVIFLSEDRFFEGHPFVQQALAHCLSKAGVPVTWFDGVGWRTRRRTVLWKSSSMKVEQLFSFPMSRIPIIKQLSLRRQLIRIKSEMARMKGNPVIWVQSRINPDLARELPYIDVYSMFDHPYAAEPTGPLCEKAKLITTQNSFLRDLIASAHPQKTRMMIPPINLSSEFMNDGEEAFPLPTFFPNQVAGYVGSFHSTRFDLAMMRKLVEEMPEVGFILVGRTDAAGEKWLANMVNFSNFYYMPQIERRRVPGVLKR